MNFEEIIVAIDTLSKEDKLRLFANIQPRIDDFVWNIKREWEGAVCHKYTSLYDFEWALEDDILKLYGDEKGIYDGNYVDSHRLNIPLAIVADDDKRKEFFGKIVANRIAEQAAKDAATAAKKQETQRKRDEAEFERLRSLLGK